MLSRSKRVSLTRVSLKTYHHNVRTSTLKGGGKEKKLGAIGSST